MEDINALRAKKSKNLPVVFRVQEIQMILFNLRGTPWLMTSLLYATGMRLAELLRFRDKDVDFGNHQIIIRGGKGDKDRIVPFPQNLKESFNAIIVQF